MKIPKVILEKKINDCIKTGVSPEQVFIGVIFALDKIENRTGTYRKIGCGLFVKLFKSLDVYYFFNEDLTRERLFYINKKNKVDGNFLIDLQDSNDLQKRLKLLKKVPVQMIKYTNSQIELKTVFDLAIEK